MASQMEARQADADEQLLLELKSKNTTRSIKNFSPEGISLESNLEGEARGVYNATFYATITMLAKPDRTIDYEERQIHTTSDGDTVLVYYKGKSIIESPTHNKFVGETTFQTPSKKLAWLNGMKARHEWEYNPVAGENDFRCTGKGSLSLRAIYALSSGADLPVANPLAPVLRPVPLTCGFVAGEHAGVLLCSGR